MPQPKKQNAKRLAKSLQKAPRNAKPERRREGPSGTRVGRDSGGAVKDARSTSPLARLIQSLGEEKIRFQIVGMTAAVLQGVTLTTLDTDIWVDLPSRQYFRLMNLCIKQGATALTPTVYVLGDGKVINFLFEVNGIHGFKREYKGSITRKIEGLPVQVLPLERILASKKAIMREKDQAHILYIERVLAGRKRAKIKR
jgi:hypothetical protein